MKKNKNEDKKSECTKEKNIPPKITHEVSRNSETDERYLPFKKVLYGYNPEEVASLIKELNDTCEASLRLQESKISSLKEELSQAIRERDYYIRKCKEFQIKSDTPSHSAENTEEYKAIIQNLTDNLKTLKEENEILKNRPEVITVDSGDKYIKKIEDLEKKLALTEKEKNDISEKYDESKNLLDTKEKELKSKIDEVTALTDKTDSLTAEKENAEKNASELELKNAMLTKRIAECEDEISALNETNKRIILENAEKLNQLESEYTQNRFAIQKDLKLYGYYIDRAELTISELSKQLSQIKQSIEKTDV